MYATVEMKSPLKEGRSLKICAKGLLVSILQQTVGRAVLRSDTRSAFLRGRSTSGACTYSWSLTGLWCTDCSTYKVRRGYPTLGLCTSCFMFSFHLMFIGHRQNVLQVPYVVDCATQRFNFGQFLVFRVRRHVFSQSHETVVDQFNAFSLPRVPSRYHGRFLLLGGSSCPSSAGLA